ncbi:hypothetical protein FCM35_KLT15183 [Carex littledalei]|uniref:Uncharacterized protein n=1 Tax=Carex littledalei TaxID=544730 RepID=A0A833V240_9POAL|nr:hypothetical protein FCM35_KLT15183 [Carex littledalei]
MAQTKFNSRDIDSDTDSDSNSSRSGNLQFVGSDSTKKTTRRRSTSHHLLMDAIEGSEEEKVPLPDYERLSQSMRLPEDMVQETEKSLTHSQSHVQKPIGRKLIEKVFKRDGEKVKEKEKEGDGDSTPVNKEKEKKKKKSSWLPDPEKRWPIQGWS